MLAPTTRTESISSHDGDVFDGYTWVPESPNGSGIVLVQEIFGVGAYIRAVAERVAALGFVVMAPDMYWRLERGVGLGGSQEDLEKAMSYAGRFDWAEGATDCGSALGHLRSLPEVTGRAGVVGFCFGGTLAFLSAAAFEPDAVVSYYGSGVPDVLTELDKISCPLLMHFGGSDPYTPRDAVARVEEAVADLPNAEIHVQEDAGHAFDNHDSPMFHNPEAAGRAWPITVEFLERNL